ncbi:MAG: hypothetical protein ACRD8O_14625 [Bryobacteraceae bacterium]
MRRVHVFLVRLGRTRWSGGAGSPESALRRFRSLRLCRGYPMSELRRQ